MHLIHDIPPRKSDDVYRMVVENPKGVTGKFEIDKELGVIGMDRILAAPMPFPFEYGFIPGTLGKSDNDPVDIMAVMPIATFPGCVLNVRVVGLYRMTDTGQEDHKVLAVADGDEMFQDVKDIGDMPKHYLKRIEFFWEYYKKLVPGSEVKGEGWHPRSDAETFIAGGLEQYSKTYVKKS